MSLNCAEIDLILGELDLVDFFIQDVVQPSYDTIAFHLYRRESLTLLVCLAPGVCRLHSTRRRVPKNDKPLRFMEFCRSRLKGARIAKAEQLNGDRIVRLDLERGGSGFGPTPELERFSLFIRLWSGAANIVVTDGTDRILDVFYRRPKRGEVTGGTWSLPEPKAASAQTPAKAFAARDLPGDSSFNERIDAWYAEHAQTLSREALVAEARRRHEARAVRLAAALDKLRAKREQFLHADQLRHQGDLLTANLYQVKAGMKAVELSDYENEGRLVLIPLDPTLKPQENAARFYEQYRKAVSGLSELEDDIASMERARVALAEELAAIEAEPNPLVIQKTLRRQNTPRQQVERKYPGLAYRKDGWLLLVGRTAAENDELLRRHVKGSDLWLHTRDWPGGYVFIKHQNGKTVPLDILLDAGTLALFYSKGRKAGTADLYYTHVKYLRRAKGAPKGTVLPTNERNLTVKLEDERLKALERCRDDA